ncbi:hypothetical protein B7463_g10074, partial [Scytalidium lignicola]
MKAFSILALSGFIASTFAAPTPISLTKNLPVVSDVADVASGPTGPIVSSFPVKRDVPVVDDAVNIVGGVPVAGSVVDNADGVVSEVAPVRRAADATRVITVLKGLRTTVISHTTIINSTVSQVNRSQSTTVIGTLVTNELNAIGTAITGVINALGPLKGTVTATTAQVTEIADLLFEIIAEISYTVFSIIQTLGIKALLNGVLVALTGIIASLLNIVESVVAGVLTLVGQLINVPGVVSVVDGVLSGLLGGILSGDLTALLPVSL